MEWTVTMPRNTNPDFDAHDEVQRMRLRDETVPRVLYWWHVPERPGTGRGMLIFVGVWFATILALAVIIGMIVSVVG